MAGSFDALSRSLSAGLGDQEAAAELAAARAARAPAAVVSPPRGSPYAPVSIRDVAPTSSPLDSMYQAPANQSLPDDDASVFTGDPLSADFGVESSGTPRAELARMAAEDEAAAEAAANRRFGLEVGGQAMDAGKAADASVYGLARQLLQRTPTGSRPNPMYAPTREYIRDTGAAGERERGAAASILDAEAELAATEEAYYIDEHARISAEAQAQADVEQVRQQRQQAEIESLRAGEEEIRKAADLFSNAPEVDPQRYWASRSGFQKFMGVLAAGAFGLAGWSPEQSLAHIRNAVDADMDAQRFNADLRRSKFGARVEAAAAGERVYDRVREAFGDDRMAEHAIRAARYEEAKARLQAMRAAKGLPLQDAQHQATLAALDKEAAAERLQLAGLSARNLPRFSTGGGFAVRGDARKVLTDLMKYEEGKSEKLTSQGLGMVGEAAKIEDTSRAKIAEAAAAGPDEEKDTKLLQAYVDDTKAAGTIVDLVTDLEYDYGDRDIPGRGLSSAVDWAISPNERADFNTKLSILEDNIGRLQSQGAVTPDEAERFRSWLTAGVGDEKMLENLRHIKRMAETRIKRADRALPKRLRAKYRNVNPDALASPEADLAGSSGRSNRPGGAGGVVAVDE